MANAVEVIDRKLYYNPSKLLSYNRVLNFVVGARGIGKTYSWTKRIIKRFINHGEQFVYLRRYKTELVDVATFFDAVVANEEFPTHRFEVKGKEFYIDDNLAGYAIPLSIASQKKSTSYPKVTTILFDEFLIDKGTFRYLDKEVDKLLGLLDTIIRNRDNVTCVCLSNAITVANPYFLYFKIELDLGQEFTVNPDYVVQIPESRDFAEARTKTRFGKMIRKTPYGGHALDNDFVGDTDDFIQERTQYSKFMSSVKLENMVIGFWLDYDVGLIYASTKYDPSYRQIALTKKDHDETTYISDNWRSNPVLSSIVRAYQKGYLRFETQAVKHACYDMLTRFNLR